MSLTPSLPPAALAAALALTAAGTAAIPEARAQIPSALVPPPPAATASTPQPAAPIITAPQSAPPQSAPSLPAPAPAPVAAAPEPPLPSPPPAPVTAAPVAVQAAPLQAPDLFSADAGRSTGLPFELWQGASLDLARAVLPMVASRSLSPAAQAFAYRLMSTSANAPDGGGGDYDLAAIRANVVLSLGDPAGARNMLAHTPNVRQSASLSQVAAEADLVLGFEDEACSLGDNLAGGKDAPYFRRLRAYCLLKAGDKAGAQLAYDLTAEQAKDDIYKRLMAAAVSGAQGPQAGPASLRNGLEYALSRRMGLDLAPAMDKAWAPVVTVVARDPSSQAPAQAAAAARVAKREADMSRAASLNPAVQQAIATLTARSPSPIVAEALAAAGASGSMEAQQALALYAAAGAPGSGRVRAAFAGFDVGPARGSQARMLELDAVSGVGAKGDAALLALWLMADAGEAGPAPADRARITRDLNRAGFGDDARRYAIEGLLSLQPPPPPPAAPPPKAVKKPVRKPRGN